MAGLTGRKCSATSEEDVAALFQSTAFSRAEQTCILCGQQFLERHAFIRHTKKAIAHYEGPSHRCIICDQPFMRKDLLTRHETTMHAKAGDQHVECNFCGRSLKPRSLAGHHKSQACRDVAAAKGKVMPHSKEMQRVFKADQTSRGIPAILRKLRDISDCVGLSALLFATIPFFGHGDESVDLWLLRKQHEASDELQNLKGCVVTAIRKATSHEDLATNFELFDAIVLLLMSIAVTDGWHMTPVHREAILRLGMTQIMETNTSAQAFIDRRPSDRFTSVLAEKVNNTQLPKCETVMHMAIRMMRSVVFFYLSGLTAQFTQPAPVGAIQHHIETLTAPSFAATFQTELRAIASVAASIGDTRKLPSRDFVYGDDDMPYQSMLPILDEDEMEG